MDTKKEALSYIDNILIVIIGVLLFAFPLIYTSQMTDAFALPKQVLVLGAVSVSLLLLGVRMIILGKVQIKSTPFDLPVFLFTIIVFASAIFAVNRYDALINFVPLLFAVLLFFSMVNSLKKETAILVSVSALVLGAAVSAIISVLSYFQIYILPSADVQFQTFSTLGSMLDQAMYYALVLPLAGYIAWPMVAKKIGKSTPALTREAISVEGKNKDIFTAAFGIGFVLILIGFGISLFMLVTIARPVILPLETGFQTAFASISQDTGRVLKSFLLGSGYGTYITDFTRFKSPTYNLNADLWSFTFFRSSSYVLELLTTTGVLGLLSFLFIGYRFVKERSLFIPLALAFIASFVLPFSFTIQFVFFALLGIFAAVQALKSPRRYPDLEFYFVALKKGFLVATPEGHSSGVESSHKGYARILPFLMAAVLVLFVGMIGYMAGRYILSDLALQRSLVAFAQNDAQRTYDAQVEAINLFPYRDTNHRVFSQLNLTLANALASSQPEGQEIDPALQNDILTLIQQSINSGRNAVTLAPQTALNWNNLSSIYRSLINFGENADQFAVVTNQEAIRLDPANPQQYINLGGIYYQLGLWTDAQNQFQIAIQLKPDYANAYYNLGHALEMQDELEAALNQYLIVRNLTANDEASLAQINSEIEALQARIGETPSGDQAAGVNPSGNQEPLGVNTPETQLPGQDPQVEIPGPSASPTPSGSTPTPSPEEEQ